MGRMMPVECAHDVIVDWGDFGPCQDCSEHPEYECPNLPRCEKCDAERLAYHDRWQEGEEAIRQLAMLRHTLDERIDHALESAANAATYQGERYFEAKVLAYRDVLTLLGPEPAWTTDNDGEPF